MIKFITVKLKFATVYILLFDFINLFLIFEKHNTNNYLFMKRSSFSQIILTLVVLMFPFCGATAQTGTIKGTIIDEKTKEPIPFASVVIEKEGTLIAGGYSDIDGKYVINSITPGMYDLKVMEITHYINHIKDIVIKSDYVIYKDFVLKEKLTLTHIDYIPNYIGKIPLISIDPTPSGQSYTSQEINKMAW
jgi:hypothetical protein